MNATTIRKYDANNSTIEFPTITVTVHHNHVEKMLALHDSLAANPVFAADNDALTTVIASMADHWFDVAVNY